MNQCDLFLLKADRKRQEEKLMSESKELKSLLDYMEGDQVLIRSNAPKHAGETGVIIAIKPLRRRKHDFFGYTLKLSDSESISSPARMFTRISHMK